MQARAVAPALFALLLAPACGFNPTLHSPDGSEGAGGADAPVVAPIAEEVGAPSEAGGRFVYDGARTEGLDGSPVASPEAGDGTADIADTPVDLPIDVPPISDDAKSDADVAAFVPSTDGAGGGAGGTGGAGGGGGSGGSDVPISGSGGIGGLDGDVGSGGATDAGGSGGSQSSGGSGGGSSSCSPGATQCSGLDLQTCYAGQWGSPVACPSRQICSTALGAARCLCVPDRVCVTVGNTCDGTNLLASCLQDPNGCFYASASSTCTGGVCTGSPGRATCASNGGASGSSGAGGRGGTVGSGGGPGTGGITASGGLSGSGGITGTGGVPGSGGVIGTGGVHGTGGTAGTGGAQGSGGSSGSPVCLALWPMPNSPLAQPDAGPPPPNLQSYDLSKTGVVIDKITGLMWQRSLSSTLYTWEGAGDYCASLQLAGYSNWRLPTRLELISIVDFSRADPAVNPTVFPPNSAFFRGYPSIWSSTTSAQEPGKIFMVYFWSDGISQTEATSSSGGARCVR